MREKDKRRKATRKSGTRRKGDGRGTYNCIQMVRFLRQHPNLVIHLKVLRQVEKRKVYLEWKRLFGKERVLPGEEGLRFEKEDERMLLI